MIEQAGHAHSSHHEAIQQFEQLAMSLGLEPGFIAVPDGQLHRVPLEKGKRGRRDGWYVLHGDGVLAGCAGNWVTGESKTWCAKAPATMSAADRAEFRRLIAVSKKAQADELYARHMAVARQAAALWMQATPCMEHPYLKMKGVASHGARVIEWPQGFIDSDSGKRDRTRVQSLVIPMRNETGTIMSLAAIAPDGRKDFLCGGRKRGCYYAIGYLVDTICIAEGFATGASVYEATGYAVAIAFDCHNLLPVAIKLRTKYPAVRIILCADNDCNTPGNPGLTKATEAAKAVGGLLAIPVIIGGTSE